jgi:predicted Zn-dependent protease with MMP-like domain
MPFRATSEVPGVAEFERLALAAFARIPEPFADHLQDIRVRVEDFADDETLAALGLDSRWQLSGLYHGHPMDMQSIWSSGQMPPVITLYRMPLLREWRETGLSLAAIVNHVVVHEVGHHFGLSDDDMAGLEGEG